MRGQLGPKQAGGKSGRKEGGPSSALTKARQDTRESVRAASAGDLHLFSNLQVF